MPHRELAQLLVRAYSDARWQAEQREHGVNPASLQGQLGSPGSDGTGDEAWQRALSELARLNEQNEARRLRARSN